MTARVVLGFPRVSSRRNELAADHHQRANGDFSLPARLCGHFQRLQHPSCIVLVRLVL
jgi:hypothetical protein